MGHIGYDANSKGYTEYAMLRESVRGYFQNNMRISVITGLPEIFLYEKRIRSRHMEAGIIGFTGNNGSNGRNHRHLEPSAFQDFINERRGGGFAVCSRNTNDRELTSGKTEPYIRKKCDYQMVEPFQASNHEINYTISETKVSLVVILQ